MNYEILLLLDPMQNTIDLSPARRGTSSTRRLTLCFTGSLRVNLGYAKGTPLLSTVESRSRHPFAAQVRPQVITLVCRKHRRPSAKVSLSATPGRDNLKSSDYYVFLTVTRNYRVSVKIYAHFPVDLPKKVALIGSQTGILEVNNCRIRCLYCEQFEKH